MRIYIAGPMRGLPEHNFPAFNAAAARFREQGHEVANPVEIGERLFGNSPSVPPTAYLHADILEVLRCDRIAVLPGWRGSVGARLEVALGVTLGLAIVDADSGLQLDAGCIRIAGGYERAPGPIDSLDDVSRDATAWANETFPHATSASRAAHLAREALELKANPTDPEEMADVFMLLGHLAAGAGVDLAAAARAKLEKNRRRKWGAPDAEGVVEHIDEPNDAARIAMDNPVLRGHR